MTDDDICPGEFYTAVGYVILKFAEARGEQLSEQLKADVMDLERRYNELFNRMLKARC